MKCLESDWSADDATHYLLCSHCIGSRRKEYAMRCTVLKDMGDGCVKVLVFGERNWRDKEHLRRIRYVPKWRVRPIDAA